MLWEAQTQANKKQGEKIMSEADTIEFIMKYGFIMAVVFVVAITAFNVADFHRRNKHG